MAQVVGPSWDSHLVGIVYLKSVFSIWLIQDSGIFAGTSDMYMYSTIRAVLPRLYSACPLE